MLWIVTLHHLVTSNKLTCNSHRWCKGFFFFWMWGSYSIEDYTNKFYSLAMRSGLQCNEDVMISMYCQQSNPNISLSLAASRLYTMADAIQVAHQMEEQSKNKALMRAPIVSNIWSENNCGCQLGVIYWQISR